jgi:hypothetical protein
MIQARASSVQDSHYGRHDRVYHSRDYDAQYNRHNSNAYRDGKQQSGYSE